MGIQLLEEYNWFSEIPQAQTTTDVVHSPNLRYITASQFAQATEKSMLCIISTLRLSTAWPGFLSFALSYNCFSHKGKTLSKHKQINKKGCHGGPYF